MFYSLTGIAVPVGQLYVGDMVAGDRIATQQEIDAYNNDPEKINGQKWAEVERRWEQVTVEVNGHIYPATSQADIKQVKDEMTDTMTVEWTENTGTWTVTKAELCEVAIKLFDAYQAIKNEVFA